MYEIVVTNQFKKDIKRLQKRGYDMNVIKEAIIKLTESGQLPPAFLPHKLSGNLLWALGSSFEKRLVNYLEDF